MSDRDVARDIRRDVEAAGGSRWVPVRSVRDAFGRTTLTRKARGEIAEALAAVGVLADPPFDAVELNDSVRLFLVETAPPPAYEPGAAPPPPPPRKPGLWDRFRAWPAWAQWAAVAAAFLLLVGVLGGGESSDDDGGGGDEQSAQQPPPDRSEEDDAEAKEEARERDRARARRKRERARERERLRERRRERRREEARERRRREREAQPPPAPEEPPEEEPSGGDGCDPNYSGCVPEYPPDVNCPEVDGPVEVIGGDPHGLDRDNDGEACEN